MIEIGIVVGMRGMFIFVYVVGEIRMVVSDVVDGDIIIGRILGRGKKMRKLCWGVGAK